MSIFVLTYDRQSGKLLGLKRFAPGAIDRANQFMLEEERRHPGMEVVLLEAPSKEHLELTHGRYFGLTSKAAGQPA